MSAVPNAASSVWLGGSALQTFDVRTVWFVGISTAGSLVHRAMPRWRPLLVDELAVRGQDLPPDAPAGAFRSLLDDLRRDGEARGAVVTSHKVALYRAASDLFAGLDDLAVACGEVNAVRRTPGGLLGFARDPVSVGRVVDRIWPAGAGDDVVCLGAGGTAIALGRHLLARPRPPRLVFADRRPGAVAHLRAALGDDVTTRVGPGPWDALVASARPGGLVVNATGLGKDRPGAPLSPLARFPAGAVVWELNYRGDLPLLALARARHIAVHDGWSLFCEGWAAALAAVLDMDDAGLGDRFEQAARPLRPRHT
jgi:shikimate 5-dehydrogenase